MADNIRLDKLISNRTSFSRSDVKNMIRKGLVKVNGTAVKASDTKITEDDIITFGDTEIRWQKHIYIILNKPENVVSSTRDGLSETVLDVIPENLRHKGIFPAGRLDKDSKGMVLLTNDGELAHKILSPKNHIPKFYLVRLTKPFDKSYSEAFREGIVLDDGTECFGARCEQLGNNAFFAVAELHQGIFHQVKRMFSAVGNKVESLFRLQMGNLAIPVNLASGDYMEILHNDVEKLLQKSDFDSVKKSVECNFSSYLINNKL